MKNFIVAFRLTMVLCMFLYLGYVMVLWIFGTGESLLFSFPTGTKMFQFPALASCYARCHSFRMTGCPIRKSSDQRLFAPARSLSQLITSFIASESQGIRHAPLLTFFQTDCSENYPLLKWEISERVRFDIYF